MRKVLDMQETRTVSRKGRTYEYGRLVEPGFVNGVGISYKTLTTLWARRWNGYQWETLHNFVIEGD